MSVDLKSIVTRFANAGGLSQEDIGNAVAAGLLYTDGHCWQLTEAGRHLLLQNPKSRLGDVDEPVLTTAIRDNPPKFSQTIPLDVQVGGDHYKKLGQYQPWEVLAVWMSPEELRGYMKGTVIAYLAREQDKGGDADIKKACHTMQLFEEVRKDK